MQRHAAPRRSGTQLSGGTDLTITDGKLHFDEGLVGLLNRRPARTGVSLWAGYGFSFPIDGEVCEIVAGLRLIPMRFERGAKPGLPRDLIGFGPGSQS
jgi:hypothetical protein